MSVASEVLMFLVSSKRWPSTCDFFWRSARQASKEASVRASVYTGKERVTAAQVKHMPALLVCVPRATHAHARANTLPDPARSTSE
jgi:hypothetical protein